MELLTGLTALLLVLLVGALFGRLHGTDSAPIKPIGDRLASGLLALPLISIAVRLAFPSVSMGWAFAAPLPLAVYLLLLAGTDLGWSISKKYFNVALLVGVGVIYAAMAACVLLFGI